MDTLRASSGEVCTGSRQANAAGQGPALVAAKGIEAGYPNKQILFGADLVIRQGEVVSLLGANGSGKSTLLNTISGFLRPSAGSIRFGGKEITGRKPHETFALGIAQVSQARDLFRQMHVEDNLKLGAYVRGGEVAALFDAVYELFPRLRERRRQPVYLMSGGEQQMVAIARALMGRPKLLLLDEPSGGLAPKVVNEIGEALLALKDKGMTMLLVEQNVKLALAVADRFMVLKNGQVAEQGEIRGKTALDEAVARSIYL